ncbi:MAG: DUF4097 family beta strand repeat-containing protein [Pyrinomonadaceae bacterium]
MSATKHNFCRIFTFAICAVVFCGVNVFAQIDSSAFAETSSRRSALEKRDDSTVRAIKAAPNVEVSIKVCGNTLNVNGWERNEVRAFVQHGEGVSIAVLGTDKKTGSPNRLQISSIGRVESGGASGSPLNCINGEKIRLDVPLNASVNVQGDTRLISIEKIGTISVENNSGNISISNVSSDVLARAFGGNILVSKSAGNIDVYSSGGNVVVYGTAINDKKDFLRAKALDGSITVQNAAQKDVKLNTVSGQIFVAGSFEDKGNYYYGTENGNITVGAPSGTSCDVEAVFSGEFSSELPLKDVTKERIGGVTSMTGKLGKGGCTMVFSSIGGEIRIIDLPKNGEGIPNELQNN